MMPATHACAEFVQDLNAYVDDQLGGDRAGPLVEHVQGCRGCQGYVDALRELSALHREGTARIDEEAVARIDPAGLFQAITGDLLGERRGALARLFYELGKAYVLRGNREAAPASGTPVQTLEQPADIRSTEARARRTLREVEQLDAAGGHGAGRGSLFRRSRKLFASSSWDRSGALAKGRRFLEEALALDLELDAARIYLGFGWFVAGRLDRARLEFRKVHREGRLPEHRLMALHWLGKLHAWDGDYRRAVECDEQVLAGHLQAGTPDVYPYLLNVALSCAKAGQVDRAVQHLGALETRYPGRVAEARRWLSERRWFTALLQRHTALRETLRQQAPAFFAA